MSRVLSVRLLKKADLRRWLVSALAATYFQYVSLGLRRAALQLGLLSSLTETGSKYPGRAGGGYLTNSKTVCYRQP
jgi:hypothetical protein